jgi:predicted nucleotidyltransferase
MLKYLSLKEKRALSEFKRKILEKLGKNVLTIKLFGSKARGDFKKDSDIDILIILKKRNLKAEDKIYKIVTDISLKYEIDLSPKIFSEAEYRERLQLELPFFLIAQKEGISL